MRRSIYRSSGKIFLKKFEICRICDVCKEPFRARHKDAKICSLKCHRKSPKIAEKRLKYERSTEVKERVHKTQQLRYWFSSEGRASYRRGGNRIQLRLALRQMGANPLVTDEVKDLYKSLTKLVEADKEKAKSVLKGGKPDAQLSFTEFKFGIDCLRASQLILDILQGKQGKVRWLLNWDSLETALQGGENKSVLFKSYLDYMLGCEEAKTLEFKDFGIAESSILNAPRRRIV